MPTSSYKDDKVEEVYEHLQEVLMKMKDNDNLMILRDINAAVGEGR